MKRNYSTHKQLMTYILLLVFFLESCAKTGDNSSKDFINKDYIREKENKELLAKGGHIVTLYQNGENPRAIVDLNLPEGFNKQLDLPVYVEEGEDITRITQLDKKSQEHFVEINLPKDGKLASVTIYRMGLMGGMADKRNQDQPVQLGGKRLQAQKLAKQIDTISSITQYNGLKGEIIYELTSIMHPTSAFESTHKHALYVVDVYDMLCTCVQGILEASFFKELPEEEKTQLVEMFHSLNYQITNTHLEIGKTDIINRSSHYKSAKERLKNIKNNFGLGQKIKSEHLKELSTQLDFLWALV
jgi:hypothetical protein